MSNLGMKDDSMLHNNEKIHNTNKTVTNRISSLVLLFSSRQSKVPVHNDANADQTTNDKLENIKYYLSYYLSPPTSDKSSAYI